MCTGGHARHVSLGCAEAEANILICPDVPSSDTQVGTLHAIKCLQSIVTVPLYSIAPCVKMGGSCGFVMRQTAAVQFVTTAS